MNQVSNYFGEEGIVFEKLNGFTNEVYKATCQGKSIILRLYGKTDLFDREREIRNACILSDMHLGAPILQCFETGRLEAYMEGTVVPSSQMLKEPYCKQIALTMKSLHSTYVAEDSSPCLCMNLRQWSVPELEDEVEWMCGCIDELAQRTSQMTRVVFCHNDLYGGNMLFQDEVTFIDFEYSSYNYVGFEIANFFCGVMEDTFTSDAVVEEPSREDKVRFLDAYGIEEDVSLFETAAHLRWALWALRKGDKVYAEKRMCQFKKMRSNLKLN